MKKITGPNKVLLFTWAGRPALIVRNVRDERDSTV